MRSPLGSDMTRGPVHVVARTPRLLVWNHDALDTYALDHERAHLVCWVFVAGRQRARKRQAPGAGGGRVDLDDHAHRGRGPLDLNRSQPGVVQSVESLCNLHDRGFSQAPIGPSDRTTTLFLCAISDSAEITRMRHAA